MDDDGDVCIVIFFTPIMKLVIGIDRQLKTRWIKAKKKKHLEKIPDTIFMWCRRLLILLLLLFRSFNVEQAQKYLHKEMN